MAKKEENPLFVEISGGNEIRRGMLECSKGILESLKEHSRFKALRDEKIRMINQFKSDIREVSKLMNILRKHLPKAKDAGIKKAEAKKAKEEKPKEEKVKEPKSKTELEKLEDELMEIENKLNSLS